MDIAFNLNDKDGKPTLEFPVVVTGDQTPDADDLKALALLSLAATAKRLVDLLVEVKALAEKNSNLGI